MDIVRSIRIEGSTRWLVLTLWMLSCATVQEQRADKAEPGQRSESLRAPSSAAALREPEVFVQPILGRLLEQEDTNGDRRITVSDNGPRKFHFTANDGARYLVEGTYALSNLLIDLGRAHLRGLESIKLGSALLFASPPAHVSHQIRHHYWDALTRKMDARGLAQLLRNEQTGKLVPHYVPHADTAALEYYRALQSRTDGLKVHRLPEHITPRYVKSLDGAPGLLTLAASDGPAYQPLPFVVPGGFFNELYGWDSYFIVLGLLADERVELARALVDHFVYELQHYGKILNANRSYYLTRSQPPFLTAMAWEVYRHLPASSKSQRWLAHAIAAAAREYLTVWMAEPHLTDTGLSRYYGEGLRVPPEVEPESYQDALKGVATRRGMSVPQLVRQYDQGSIESEELDAFFAHDRAVRESGHDRTWRLVGRATHLNSVALNALLFRYEVDIARAMEKLDVKVRLPDNAPASAEAWRAQAAKRGSRMISLCWNEKEGLFFDYDFVKDEQHPYVSATTLYPLWAGMLEGAQAARLAKNALSRLEAPGGLLASAKESRAGRPARQWDYPHGWAPHQMLAWQGLLRYGRRTDAQRLAYRWLYLVAMAASRNGGAVVEKYNVVRQRYDTHVAYGNVGAHFELVPEGGFGWTNASFQVGLNTLSHEQRASLERMVPPSWLFGRPPVQPE